MPIGLLYSNVMSRLLFLFLDLTYINQECQQLMQKKLKSFPLEEFNVFLSKRITMFRQNLTVGTAMQISMYT